MHHRVKRIAGLLVVAVLSAVLALPASAQETAAPLTAPPTSTTPTTTTPSTLEARIQELEKRLEALERLLALTSVDIPSLVEKTAPAVVSLYLVSEDHDVLSQGTGFLWSADGMIMTNAHVVDEDEKIIAKFVDGQVKEAERVLVDPFLDLAILNIEGEGYPFLRLATEPPRIGSPVVVIGNAYGYSNSVAAGIVSGTDRPDPMHYWHYPSLQTDAAINHGNSGGPILNPQGEVVAVATWTELKDETDGIAFGIPAHQVRAALDRYDPKRGVVRPWLGISAQEPYWTRGGLPNDLGLLVTDVHPKGAAAKAGLKADDFILAVNDTPVNYLHELRTAVEKAKPGEKLRITLDRYVNGDYKTMTITVTAGEYSAVVPALVPTEYYYEETDDLF